MRCAWRRAGRRSRMYVGNKKRIHRLYRLEGMQVRMRPDANSGEVCTAARCRRPRVATSTGAWTSSMASWRQVVGFGS
jgi:hypothetical protein